jgi:hypothetical protein
MLELSGRADPFGDRLRLPIPELASFPRDCLPATLIQVLPFDAWSRTHQFQQFGMVETPICSDSKLEARDLRSAYVDGDHTCRIPDEKRKRVVARRSDRQAGVPRMHIERIEEHVGVLPALRITNPRECGS